MANKEGRKAEDITSIYQVWQEKFGKDITIMPGGGVRSGNIAKIVTEAGVSEVHSGPQVQAQDLLSAFPYKIADESEIREMRQILNSL